MSDEISDTMNLDLNLGPGADAETSPAPIPSEVRELDGWVFDPSERVRVLEEFLYESSDRVREATRRIRTRQRWRQLQIPIPLETQNLSVELNQLAGGSANGSTMHTGEGSIAAEERVDEEPKTCENGNGKAEDNVLEKNDDVDKSSGSDGSFFDCNICLDLAKDPVVTCCGHLFCWPCLYRWLHLHSEAKECPVCKGEVTTKTVTPIYGRGTVRSEPEEDLEVKIPMRPQARRTESLRQTLLRNPFGSHMEEVMRRIQSRFDRESNTSNPDLNNRGASDIHERATSLLNRFLTSRGLRGEQNQDSAAAATASENIDLTENVVTELEAEEAPSFLPFLLRRRFPSSQRAPRIPSFSSALNSAERWVDTYLRGPPMGRNHQDLNLPVVDDRDSFSSIAAVINSESQVDTAVEIDSMVTLSTSSSRRRNENGTRVSDMDSADSRPPRRRRLN